jgi:hypothetical protein
MRGIELIDEDVQWRSHVQPLGSYDTDEFAVTPYSDCFFAGYDPTKILARPQWPSGQQLFAEPSSNSQSMCSAHPIQ